MDILLHKDVQRVYLGSDSIRSSMRKLLTLIVLITFLIPSVSGLDWTHDTRLTNDLEISETPIIALDHLGRVHIVWRSIIGGAVTDPFFESGDNFESGNIYYLQLNELGKVAVGPIKVASKAKIEEFHRPFIAIDSKNAIHVFWDGTVEEGGLFSQVYYAKLDDRGDILEGPSAVLSKPSSIKALILDQKGDIHVGWMSFTLDNTGSLLSEVYYSKFDGGSVGTHEGKRHKFEGGSYGPELTIDSDSSIHAVYKSQNYQDNELLYTKLDSAGKILVNDFKLFSLNDSTAYSLSLGIDTENTVHMVFESQDTISPLNIHYAKLDNGGKILVDRIRTTASTRRAFYPKITMDNIGDAHVVWQDERDENSEIYYLKLDKNGFFKETGFRLTNNSGLSSTPDIAIDGNGNVHLVWADNRDGNFEIYYKKGVITSSMEVISSEQADIAPDIEPQILQKLRDSSIFIALIIVILVLVLLVMFYKIKVR